jgi:predicted amidohydrolase YtcJ
MSTTWTFDPAEGGWRPGGGGPGLRRALEGAGLDGDAALLPPLWDHHGHLLWLGALLEQTDLRGSATPEEAADRVARGAAALPSGSWVRGFGWDQNQWRGEFPHRDLLDARLPGRPVLLNRIDGHAGWASSEALRRAGVPEDAPDPPGGRFLRREGRLTGVLLDRALEPVEFASREAGRPTLERRLLRACDHLRAWGLCGATDMGLDPDHAEVLSDLDRAGRLPIGVVGFLWSRDGDLPSVDLPPGKRFRLAGRKFFTDGALGSRGAALFDDYSDAPGERGHLLWETPDLAEALRRTAREGLEAAVHAIGDRALDQVLSAAEEAGIGPLLRVEHAQVAPAKLVERMARLGLRASLQPCHRLSDAAWAPSRLGPRHGDAYGLGRFRAAGIPLLLGTDFPIEEPDPARTLLAALSHRPGEKLSWSVSLESCRPPEGFDGSDIRPAAPLPSGAYPEAPSWLEGVRFCTLPRETPP